MGIITIMGTGMIMMGMSIGSRGAALDGERSEAERDALAVLRVSL
jgi:hypothetical protein